MIGLLRGGVAEVTGEAVLLDVGGVGYEVHVPMRMLAQLAPLGGPASNSSHPSGASSPGAERKEVTLHTYLHVREEVLQLYGFSSREEKEMFLRLLSVSKVGPKVALAVLSGFSAATLWEAILREDVTSISRMPGVGRKTAERLVLELREKLPPMQPAAEPGTQSVPGAPRPPRDEAREALLALGYSLSETAEALAAVSPEAGAEEALRTALKNLAR